MRITTNYDYINYFMEGGRDQKKCNNLKIEGNKLINYNTVIAQFEDGYLYVNMTKYSTSSSRIQNMLLEEAEHYYYSCLIVVNEIQKNAKNLI